MNHYEMPTIDKDGIRKWLYPIVSKGAWWRKRKYFAYFLIVVLLALPWINIKGRQSVFFDLAHQRINFFGLTFFINEIIIFTGFLFFFISSILLLTAIFGRVFCGWACPQTVFLEFVFRPIEQLLEGMGLSQKRFNQHKDTKFYCKKTLKILIFAAISFVLSNTLVAYFTGSHQVIQYMNENPMDHQIPFFSMIILFVIIFFQFSWFREQVCTFICPYGRLQSLLLDKHSLVVAYDESRGEPRGKPSQVAGDCVDCGLCVQTCPTGIDIREGLQMECVHCTQCMDACDQVMIKLNRKPGLIDYRTESNLQNEKTKIIRPRLFIYGLLFLLGTALMLFFGGTRSSFQAVISRQSNSQLFIQKEDVIINPMRMHIRNLENQSLELKVEPLIPADLKLSLPQGEISIDPQEKKLIFILLELPKKYFKNGKASASFKVLDIKGDFQEQKVELFGPESK